MRPFDLKIYTSNLNLEIITREGNPAKIIYTNRKGYNVKPVVALITIPNGTEVIKTYWENGIETQGYTDNPNDYVLVQGNADLKSNKISPRVWTKEITKQVHKGEIIMTVRAPVGYLAMANMDAVIGRGVAAIDGNKYLYYLLHQ